jgi:hypothetical protein
MSATYFLNCEGDDRPRSLREANVRQQRKAMLGLPHVAKLTAYTAELRRDETLTVPDFDPLDGGVDARVLFLFEKPGPMTVESGERGGSGFISRNNDDPTAEATFRFMKQAGIPRKLTVIWNVVPWWNGTRKITARELRQGVARVGELVKLLPALLAVVTVVRKATRAKACLVATTKLTPVDSYHPSPIVKATSPEKWEMIPSQWAEVMKILEGSRRPREAIPVLRECNQERNDDDSHPRRPRTRPGGNCRRAE